MIRGLCRYESLKDGTVDLADIALMNDALDVQADNQLLLEQYSEQKKVEINMSDTVIRDFLVSLGFLQITKALEKWAMPLKGSN